ncbi:potassium transporter Kup [Brevundimonas sp. FT23028]|uniref:potassium transporter Kup n=1 Tax=Brevundimonas sp. FT23028 TaxID=3393748 RepID=UPI003B5860D9
MTGEPAFATPSSAPSDLSQKSSTSAPSGAHARFWPLALGSIGVVYGDIGTSPLYAFREALGQASRDGVTASAALGVCSLALWALILVVTVKYVIFLTRLSNQGEGGVLSLMALAQRAVGRRTALIFALGVTGAALFYGDAIITPAISVLSAVEGLKSVPGVGGAISPATVLILSGVILIALFAVQSRGTAKVAAWFGPICVVWFAVLAVLGLSHIVHQPGVLAAFNPVHAVGFLAHHGTAGLFVLGSVFLTVTGAEALYADMGHFGRKPIVAAWLWLVLPCLALNYLGQGAMALQAVELARGARVENADWFFTMAPELLRAPVVVLATLATVIASQAVITGAFSLTSQAMQLGLLPRMKIARTSEHEAGQIYIGRVNIALLIGVVVLVAVFKSSAGLAHAYGLAVTGTMVVTTALAFIVVRRLWNWPLWKAALLFVPMLAIDLVFLGANALKILSGGFVPLMLGAALFMVMATWVRGAERVRLKTAGDTLPLAEVVALLAARKPHRAPGTAVFLAADNSLAPAALMHNLKHNHVLHETNVVLSIHTADAPRVADADRLTAEQLDGGFWRVTAVFGYMEQPSIPRLVGMAKRAGLKVDLQSTSFFLGKRTVVAAPRSGLPRWQAKLFMALARNAASASDVYRLPPGRVVEMGAQISV